MQSATRDWVHMLIVIPHSVHHCYVMTVLSAPSPTPRAVLDLVCDHHTHTIWTRGRDNLYTVITWALIDSVHCKPECMTCGIVGGCDQIRSS